MTIKDFILDVFTILGGFVTAGGFILFLYMIKELIAERFRKIRYEYRVKHRFDKPPLAQCYCVDCYWFDPSRKRCISSDRATVEDRFCSSGRPKERS